MIYLDHASSSKVEQAFAEAAQAMLPRFYANPNAHHTLGYEISQLMEDSRKKVGKAFHFTPEEVIFTASGSEAVNLAIKGIAIANQNKGKHIITIKTEHHCVLNSVSWLKQWFQFEISECEVDQKGRIDLKQLREMIRQDTTLIAVMAVNNEIATIHPIDEIKKIIKEVNSKAVLFVDAIAAVGKIDQALYMADVMAISQHKLGGLSGSGCLLKKRHIAMAPIISGGQQEHGLRGGTPFAIANILFGDVIQHALMMQKSKQSHITSIQRQLIDGLCLNYQVDIVSDQTGSPYIVSFVQPNVPSSIILNVLNQEGIFVSSHSACASDSNQSSHVLQACGYLDQYAMGMIRVSFHYDTTQDDIQAFLKAYEKVSEYAQ